MTASAMTVPATVGRMASRKPARNVLVPSSSSGSAVAGADGRRRASTAAARHVATLTQPIAAYPPIGNSAVATSTAGMKARNSAAVAHPCTRA